MKYLTPLPLKSGYYTAIELELNRLFYELFYKPILMILRNNEITNAKKDALVVALESGKVSYWKGAFTGKFTAEISKSLKAKGATYSKGVKAWILPTPPADVQATIAKIEHNLNKSVRQISETLNDVNVDYIISQVDFTKQYEHTVSKIDTDFDKTAKSITIEADLTPAMRGMIARDYSDNMKLYIKDFTEQHIKDLREKVQENVFSGLRASELEKMIMESRNVTASKAKFLARQETSLLLSKYSEQRYKDAGITKYRWSTSHDIRVRHDHKELDGKIISFDNPPVVDVKTGRKAHAGEDFGCLPADANINLAYGVKKCFRRWYVGIMTEVVLGSGKTIRATPNHQVLTLTGWKAINSLDSTDYLINLSDDLVEFPKTNINSSIPSISQIFDAFNIVSKSNAYHSKTTDFHGDGVEGDVNVIDTTRFLSLNDKAFLCQNLNHLTFTNPDSFAFRISDFFKNYRTSIFNLRSPYSIGFFCNRFFNFLRGILKSNNVCFRDIPNLNPSVIKPSPYHDTLNAKPFGNGKLAFARIIGIYNWLRVNFQSITRLPAKPSIGIDTSHSEAFRNVISMKSDNLGDFVKTFPLIQQLDSVVNISSKNFSGHVYNLETYNNWYCYEGIITHNCRCVKIPIVE